MLRSFQKYAWVLLLVLLPACNLLNDGENAPFQVRFGEAFVIRLGDTVILDKDTQITFEELKGDSRCPLRVLCIWEGEIEAIFRIETSRSSDALEYKGFLDAGGEMPLEQLFDRYQIFLERIDPYPGEGAPSGGIIATLRVLQVETE